jgi:hypothetical protein
VKKWVIILRTIKVKELTLIIDHISINLEDVILMGSIMAKVSSSSIVVKDHYINASTSFIEKEDVMIPYQPFMVIHSS